AVSSLSRLPSPHASACHAAATTEIYTLSLHDALPIFHPRACPGVAGNAQRAPRRRVVAVAGGTRSTRSVPVVQGMPVRLPDRRRDRKSTRLNSSHVKISYAVFCLKKKKKTGINCAAGL